MEFNFEIKRQVEFGFIYDFNTGKLKLHDLEEYVAVFLQENVTIDKNSKNDFISLFNNELNSVREKGVINIEKEIVIPSVGTRYLIVTGTFNKDKNIVEGVIIDDTTNKVLHHKTLQAERLKSLGALAGGIAHDFNNQLMVILGSCELLKKYVKQDGIQLLENIEKSASSSAELINKLLTFGHPERIPKLAFNLLNTINDTISILERTSSKKVSILYDCFIKEIMIYGNYGLIQNAILNICKNSIESFDKDGILMIKASIVHLKKLPDDVFNKMEYINGVYGQIQISDNGCGIKSEIINKIFDPFYTTKGFDKGTGLGLSTVLGTMESHKGLIGVRSKENKGTTFTLYFRLTKGAEVMFLQEKNVKKQIMIIDDEELVRMILKEMLTDMGYDVLCFQTGREALEYYKVNMIDISLVICDMMMPSMTGKEVFYEMKKINSDVKFVILSGYSKEEDETLISNLDAYLTKPISSFSLREIVEKLVK